MTRPVIKPLDWVDRWGAWYAHLGDGSFFAIHPSRYPKQGFENTFVRTTRHPLGSFREYLGEFASLDEAKAAAQAWIGDSES